MPFAADLRPLPEILARAVTRRLRLFMYNSAAPVILQWRHAQWIRQGERLLSEVGPVHVTLTAHESLRGIGLFRFGWTGVQLAKESRTWTLHLVFFVFMLSMCWCHTPDVEKVDPYTLSRRGI